MNDNLNYNDPSGIVFHKVKNPDTLFNQGPVGIKNRIVVNGDQVESIDDDKHLINAVDIDWNGAEMDENTIIDTTGQLLAYIKAHGSGDSNPNNPSTPTTQKFYDQRNFYRWYEEGVTPLTPSPSGANYNGASVTPLTGDSNSAHPAYWSIAAVNRPQNGKWILWQCTALIETNNQGDYVGIVQILAPVPVSGINGTPGEDLTDKEYIYKSFAEKQNFTQINDSRNPANWSTNDNGLSTPKKNPVNNDYLGPAGYEWDDSPEGIDEDHHYEYWATREKRPDENGIPKWGPFSIPVIHSNWGKNGMDGDGVEYVFARTSINRAPVVSNNQGNQKQDEYLPIVQIPSNSGGLITGDDNRQGLYSYQTRCSDDMVGVDSTYKYEWALKRKKVLNPSTGNKEWEDYPVGKKMSCWGVFNDNNIDIQIIDGYLYINGEKTIKIDNGDTGTSGIPNICPGDPDLIPSETPIINCNGNIKVYFNGDWYDIGQAFGNGGYMHIAYADDIILDEDHNNMVIGIKGFSATSSSTSKKWTGIGFTDNATDPGAGYDWTYGTNGYYEDSSPTTGNSDQQTVHMRAYKWNMKDAIDGNGVEFVFCLSKTDDVVPGFKESNYSEVLPEGETTHGVKNESEFYPIITSNNNQVTNESNFKGREIIINGNTYVTWCDDPPQLPDSEWKYLWWGKRTYIDGQWGNFTIFNKDQYTESAVQYYIKANHSGIKKTGNSYNVESITFTQMKITGSVESEVNDYTFKYSVDAGNTQNGGKQKSLTLNLTGNNRITPTEAIYVQLVDTNNNQDKVIASLDIPIYTDGINSYDKEIFKWFASGATITPPDNVVNPSGWSTNNSIYNSTGDSQANLIMYQGHIVDNILEGGWQGPYNITTGEDSGSYEFIYKRFTEEEIVNLDINQLWANIKASTNSLGQSKLQDDFVPDNWTDNPSGVGYETITVNGQQQEVFYKYEYASIRVKSTNGWNDFIQPFPWSVYGNNGHDGDGIQYIFCASSNSNAPKRPVRPSQVNGQGEWLPIGKQYINSDISTYGTGNGNKQSVSVTWQDDPPTLNGTDSKFIYVSTIKQLNGQWGEYSIPTLWARWSDQGPKGDFTSRVFTRVPAELTNLNGISISGTVSNGYNTYDNPIPPPTTYTIGTSPNEKTYTFVWNDGTVSGSGILWSTSRKFTYNDGPLGSWAPPQKEQDNESLDIEFSPNLNKPNPPAPTIINIAGQNVEGPPQNSGTKISATGEYGSRCNGSQDTSCDWYDPNKDSGLPNIWDNMIWRAERKVNGGQYVGNWVITKIKGEESEGSDDTVISSPAPIILEQNPSVKDSYGNYPIDYGFGINQNGTSIIENTPPSKCYTTIKAFRNGSSINIVLFDSNPGSNTNNFEIPSNTCTPKCAVDNNGVLKIWITDIYKTTNNNIYTYPNREGKFKVKFKLDGDDTVYESEVSWYVNLVGTWVQTIEDGVEHSVSTKIISGLNDQNTPNEVTTLTHIGEYIRGWAENTSQLSTSIDGITTEMSEIKQTSDKISLYVSDLNSSKELLKNIEFLTDSTYICSNWKFKNTSSDQAENFYYNINNVNDPYNNRKFKLTSTSKYLTLLNNYYENVNDQVISQLLQKVETTNNRYYILKFEAYSNNSIFQGNKSVSNGSTFVSSFKLYLVKDIDYTFNITGYSQSSNNQIKVKIYYYNSANNTNKSFTDTVILESTSSQNASNVNINVTPKRDGSAEIYIFGNGNITNITSNYSTLGFKLPSSSSNLQELSINNITYTGSNISTSLYLPIAYSINSIFSKYTIIFKAKESSSSGLQDFIINNYFSMPEIYLRNISLKSDIKEGLEKTGIDIESGKITATTDNFEIQNSNGNTTFSVDEDGNIVGRGNATFGGKISAESIITGSTIYGANTYSSIAYGHLVQNYSDPQNIKYEKCYYCIQDIQFNSNIICNKNSYYYESELLKITNDINNQDIDLLDYAGNTSDFISKSNSYSTQPFDLNDTEGNEPICFVECTGKSDIIISSFLYTNTINASETITLPNPSDFVGKIVSIRIQFLKNQQKCIVNCCRGLSSNGLSPIIGKGGAELYNSYLRPYTNTIDYSVEFSEDTSLTQRIGGNGVYNFLAISSNGDYYWILM